MFVLPDSRIQHTTQIMESCGNHLTCRVGDARKKMRPDMMVAVMTDTEQHTYTYLPHDTDTGSRLPNLQPTMPSSKARKSMIIEGGYCSDVSYLEKANEKKQQHAKLEGALRPYIWIRRHLFDLHLWPVTVIPSLHGLHRVQHIDKYVLKCAPKFKCLVTVIVVKCKSHWVLGKSRADIYIHIRSFPCELAKHKSNKNLSPTPAHADALYDLGFCLTMCDQSTRCS